MDYIPAPLSAISDSGNSCQCLSGACLTMDLRHFADVRSILGFTCIPSFPSLAIFTLKFMVICFRCSEC